MIGMRIEWRALEMVDRAARGCRVHNRETASQEDDDNDVWTARAHLEVSSDDELARHGDEIRWVGECG